MHSFLAHRLDVLAQWRARIDRSATDLARWLKQHDLYGEAERDTLRALRDRLRGDRMMVAFVAEFSRGKSELVNALLFAQTGRRVLPASAGRTTMCPVELRWDSERPPEIALLPIETRSQGLALADLREQEQAWTRIALDPKDPEGLANAMQRVTDTRSASVDEARSLGLWNDDDEAEQPPRAADGSVEVPLWRHAVVNFPHPLLERGLVVLDTPGLNAIGAEPELTLGLLPSAHAAVFVLAADTGVTRSDLTLWREHLLPRTLERFVVLNKIDTLVDPMAPEADLAPIIQRQCETAARLLEVEPDRVYALSAREAVMARASGRLPDLVKSRLPDLEAALGELVPRQHGVLAQSVREDLDLLSAQVSRALADRRRQHAEQLLELRSLRGKSASKVRLLLKRVQEESEQFEESATRLAAVRAVQLKMQRAAQAPLSRDGTRGMVAAWRPRGGLRAWMQGGAEGLDALFVQLQGALRKSRDLALEMQPMLSASFDPLNAEFGFALVVDELPDLDRSMRDLGLVEKGFRDHLSSVRSWRVHSPEAVEQYRNLLLSRLRFVFEGAHDTLEQWGKSVGMQFDAQLIERRRAFRRRRDALERIRSAAHELEARIGEMETGEQLLRARQQELQAVLAAAHEAANSLHDPVAERAAA